jgi:hypothetical protein
MLSQDLNTRLSIRWLVVALAEAFIVFFIPYSVYRPNGVWGDSGEVDGKLVFGNTVYTSLVVAMIGRVLFMHHTWTSINWFFLGWSVFLYVLFLSVYSNWLAFSPVWYQVAAVEMSRPVYWLSIVLVVTAVLVLELTLAYFNYGFFLHSLTKPEQVLREIERGYGNTNVPASSSSSSSAAAADASAVKANRSLTATRLDRAPSVRIDLPQEEHANLGINEANEERSSFAFNVPSAHFGVGA